MYAIPRVPDDWKRLAFLHDARAAGGRVFAVGGAIRDLVFGLRPAELDVVVGGIATDRLGALLARTGSVSFVGKSFGVFKWTPPDGHTVDVAVPRRERSTGPGHRDFEVEMSPATPIEDDLARRDFTINAVAVELPDGPGIDPHGGVRDATERVLRAVGAPADRFREDPLRILRGAGFVSRFGLAVEPGTRRAMAECAGLLPAVSPERIATELVKLLGRGVAPSDGLRLLRDIGALVHVLPEFEPAVGFDQCNPHHSMPLDEHTFAVVDGVAARGGGIEPRMAALFHDLGKPQTAALDLAADGSAILRFHGHEQLSGRLARAAGERLRLFAAEGFPRDGMDRVVALVNHHRLDVDEHSSDGALRRLVSRVGGARVAHDLVTLWAADRAAHRDPFDDRRADALRARLDTLGEVPLSQRDLAVSGADLEARFGVHGPALGALKNALLGRVVDGEIPNEREALMEAARKIAGREVG